jgi:predicted nucleotidyltransferase
MTIARSPAEPTGGTAIPGIPGWRARQLLNLLTAQPEVQAVWLFGSRAMGRYQPGSDIDLCLEAPGLTHGHRLQLLAALEDLPLPWRVDLVLQHQLDEDVQHHVQRVGHCLWRRP